MRTDELRTLLRERGEEVVDLGAHGRVGAVHERVRTVRRRRAAAAGGGLVAAVAAVALAVVPGGVLDRQVAPADAPTRLAGHVIPETLVSAGFTYDYTEGIEAPAGESSLKLTLPDSDTPRLLAWASDSARLGAFVTAKLDGRELLRDTAGELEAFEYVPPGQHEVLLRQAGIGPDDRLGLAVYSLSDIVPAGVSDGRTTFREEILDDRLVDGWIGEPGESTHTFEVSIPEGGLRVATTCYGVGGRFEVWDDMGGVETGGSWTVAPDRDAGTSGGSWTSAEAEESLRAVGKALGDQVTARVWLVDARTREPVTGIEDAVIGAAVYAHNVPQVDVFGVSIPQRIEFDGHVWEYDGQPDRPYFGGRPGNDDVWGFTDAHQRTRLYAGVVQPGSSKSLTWQLTVDGRVVDTVENDFGTGSVSWSTDMVVPREQRARLGIRVTRGVADDTQIALAAYDRVE